MFAELKKIKPSKKSLSLLNIGILLLCLLASSWSLFIPGLGTGHDLNHQARIFEMSTGLKEMNFPVIWSQNLAYGFGMPLFQFYAPFPYFIGALFYLIGFNLSLSVKMVILLANLLTLIGAYLLGKELFKKTPAATLSAVLIVLAPYRAVDIFVRTAFAEAWAIAFILFSMLGIARILHNKKYGTIILAVAYSLLALSHNLTALFSTPFIGLFGLGLFLKKEKVSIKLTQIKQTILGLATGFLLSSFYSLPAFLEKHLTKIDEFTLSSYYDFHQHFLYIRQFFKPWGKWEYGGSGWGPNDEMSFFLGLGQIAVLVLAVLVLLWNIIIKKKKIIKEDSLIHLSLLFITASSLFMTLIKSQFLWDALKPVMSYIQFPWRLLSISLIAIGLLAGVIYTQIPKKLKTLFFVLLLMSMFANIRYFQFDKYRDYSDTYSDYRSHILVENSNNLYDYIPQDVSIFTKQGFYLYKNPEITEIATPVRSFLTDDFTKQYQPNIISEESTKKEFSVELESPQTIMLNLSYYPGWTVYDNDKIINTEKNKYGLVSFYLEKGSHTVSIRLEDTPIRFWSKITTIIGITLFGYLLYSDFITKDQRKQI